MTDHLAPPTASLVVSTWEELQEYTMRANTLYGSVTHYIHP